MAAETRQSDAVLERLTALHPKLIDLELGRVQRLLAALGHPEARLPPVVHVAGTNGKGSVVAFLKAICESAGLKTHVYTSPHLVRFAERIVVAGTQIEEGALLRVLEECEAANEGRPITFFEITTAAAFLAFARTHADIALLETGLGGRFDATNVVARPAATVITPVSLDHMAFLGPTVDKIAFEKAGILKRGATCILCPQTAEAERVIRARATEVGTPVLSSPEDWRARRGSQGIVYEDAAGHLELPEPVLAGEHQIGNSAAAIATLRALGWKAVDARAIAAGLQSAKWPARLQHVVDGPYVKLLPEGWELWLDGGHNSAAGAALAQFVARWTDKPLYLVTGMLNTRDPATFLAPLAPFVAGVRTLAIHGDHNSWTAAETAASAQKIGMHADAAEDLSAALRSIVHTHKKPARILICGSLYLAGTVLAGAA